MVLPKVPDHSAYYSRQLYQYNLTVIKGYPKPKETQKNVTIYAWLENEYSKGSNELCLAIWDSLNSARFKNDLNGKNGILLCADGCTVQNKNTTMIGMLCKWFTRKAPGNIKTVTMMFPVVGHSFLPPDRVFGRIEKVIRKRETISNPEEYSAIFKDFGSNKKLGSEEVPVFDWKTDVHNTIKPPGSWHFRFTQAKRFILKKTTKILWK